jgi:hypothetical protein
LLTIFRNGENEQDKVTAKSLIEKYEKDEEIDDTIEPYTLDLLFKEINYKRTFTKAGEVEDGEVEVSSEECEPYGNNEASNKDSFENSEVFTGSCTNCGE